MVLANRQCPYQPNGRKRVLKRSANDNDSFPSSHSGIFTAVRFAILSTLLRFSPSLLLAHFIALSGGVAAALGNTTLNRIESNDTRIPNPRSISNC